LKTGDPLKARPTAFPFLHLPSYAIILALFEGKSHKSQENGRKPLHVAYTISEKKKGLCMSTPLEIVKKKRMEAIDRIKNRSSASSKIVHVGMATCEIAAGSKDVMEVFRDEIKKGLTGIYLSQKGCAGRCNLEPTVEVIEKGRLPVKYGRVTKEMAREIIERHIKQGEIIKEWRIN
jgi:(2Fe-2S) ferredoxin